MLDHGALGTLIIGLDRVRREQDDVKRPARRSTSSAQGRRVGRVVAGWLRAIADVLEPRRSPRDLPTEA